MIAGDNPGRIRSFMRFFFGFILCVLFRAQALNAQQLDSILPVFRLDGSLTDSVSFILTASDYNLWQGQPAKYVSSIQIIDAANPWPPRWFATSPVNSVVGKNNERGRPFINVSEQNGKIVFSSAVFKQFPGGHNEMQDAVLMFKLNFELTDTFYKPGLEIDVHDFAINNKGEKLYFLVCDTVVNMRGFIKNASDSLVSISYEKIQIDDNLNKTIFSWSPVESLGIGAMYQPYSYEKSVINKSVNFEWSHGNSLCWDKDGNILYSFKYIGIGKISRVDGHTMWRVDRSNQRATPSSDSLPIFLQHDLEVVKDGKTESTYTVLSNGDSTNPHCAAYQFIVKENNIEPHLKIIKGFNPVEIPQTGGGNYDVDASGNFLINYGLYKGNPPTRHILFDYRDEEDKLLARYTTLPESFCYRIHRVSGVISPRPVVIERNGMLLTKTEIQNATWYELSGKDMQIVTVCSNATRFKPAHMGKYCVAVKQGIGYGVSKVYNYYR